MEAMDKRKKDRLIRGITLNVIVCIGCIAYVYFFVVPKYETMNILIADINNTALVTASLKQEGVSASDFSNLLTRTGKRQEISDTVFSDSEKLGKALLKPANVSGDYLSWLIEENGKIADLDKEIRENEAILGSIIPVFTNSVSVDVESGLDNQITLTSFISYIEKNILGKYALTSYAPLGISNISFSDKRDSSVNIGSFKVSFDFKGKNSNIFSLIDTIQKSWKLTIRNGKLISDTSSSMVLWKEKGLSDLSNLLITIDSLSLENPPNNPSLENQGNITLEFYVEGMNYQKVLLLRTLLTAKFTGLQKSVKEKGLLCTKPGNPLCDETSTANAIATIKGLIKDLSALQPKFDDFKKGGVTVDINREMETLSDIKASLQTIEMIYLKNNSILEKAKKQK